MSTNLYEVLGVTKDATTEQIRKAYKKQALKTHPDKLPSGVSDEERASAAENFREISHACEILTDPERRREYDAHGVWPPPEPGLDSDFGATFGDTPSFAFGHRQDPFSSPFFSSPRHHSRSRPTFRDPFELFNAIFRDFDDIFTTHAAPSTHDFAPFGSPFSQGPRDFFNDPFFGPASGFPFNGASPFSPMLPSSPFARGFGEAEGSRGHCVQTQSFVSHSVNGVTQSTYTRRDRDGNEHITRKFPDGREVHTVNGVEQPPRASIQQAGHESRRLDSSEPSHRSSLPSYSQPHPTHRHRRNFSPSYQSRRNTLSSTAQEYDTSPPSYTRSSSSFRPYTQSSDGHTSGHFGGPTPYNERRHRRVQRTSDYT